MSKKKIALALFTLAVIFAAAFLFRANLDSSSLAEDSGQGMTAQFFVEASAELTPAQNEIDCRKISKLAASMGEESPHYWQDNWAGDEEREAVTAVHFDAASRALTVCHKGRKIAGLLPTDSESESEMVRVTEAQFSDMNADGKPEFLVFRGQCTEGPCLGQYLLFQIAGDKIRQLYTLHAETVERVNEGGKRGLRLEKYCFTFEFGMGPSYFSVAEFSVDGSLATVPYRELRTRFPEATGKMTTSRDLGIDDEAPPMQKAYLKIHDLFVDAYQGKPKDEIFKSYEAILSELLPAEGERSPDDRLSLHCDTREILELITGN